MARTSLSDYLQVYPFWLMDVAPIEPLAFPIFTPMLGFSAITAPEVTAELQTITEANFHFNRKVIKTADAGSIILSRAAKWYDSDFYQWMVAALAGDTGGRATRGGQRAAAIGGATPRRDLLLVQFLSRSPIPQPYASAASAAGLLALQGTVTGMVGGAASLGSGAFIGGAVGLAGAAVAAGFGASLGPVEQAPRIPAKAWVLYGCIPTRYKSGGDFDATSSDISIQELEVAVESWDEISLGMDVAAAVVAVDAVVANTARTR